MTLQTGFANPHVSGKEDSCKIFCLNIQSTEQKYVGW